jgi:tRNA threonylcarbamoyladenosine biosynthesis protein TsaB
VYTSVFTPSIETIRTTEAVELDNSDFIASLSGKSVHFSGDGAAKAQHLLAEIPGATFSESGMQSAANLAQPAEEKLNNKDFEDVAYYVPFYLKTFHPGPQRSSK